MKKIIGSFLAVLFFIGCVEKEKTYTIKGEWVGGDGKVVYLKKDLGDKNYETLDSAVVAGGKFLMQKPLGDVDERVLEINGKQHIIILDSVPILVKCESTKKTIGNKELESVKTDISGSIEQDIFKSIMQAQASEMLVMLGFSFMSEEDRAKPGLQDSLAQMYVSVKAQTERTIDSLVTNYPDSYAVALIVNNFVAKQRELPEVEKMYESLTPGLKMLIWDVN